jgi:hypothetical protein
MFSRYIPDPSRVMASAIVQLSAAHTRPAPWGVEWIKRRSVTDPLTDVLLAEIKRAIAAGHPVAAGFRWPKKLNGADILSVPAAHQAEDGHSVAKGDWACGNPPELGMCPQEASARWGRRPFNAL